MVDNRDAEESGVVAPADFKTLGRACCKINDAMAETMARHETDETERR